VLRAGWTVPVVLTVSAAPAAALSGPINITSVSGSCKLPGNSGSDKFGYVMLLTFTADQPGTVHIVSFVIEGAPTTAIDPDTFPVNAGDTTVRVLVVSENSAQRTATITYTFTPTGGTTSTQNQLLFFQGFPPCKASDCDAGC
jgi:hypothetical protein